MKNRAGALPVLFLLLSYFLIPVIGTAGFILDEDFQRICDVMDFAVDESFPIDPRVFEIRGEDDLLFLFDYLVDRLHDAGEIIRALLLEAHQSFIEPRLDVKGIAFFIFIGVHELIALIHEGLVLVKRVVKHKILAKQVYTLGAFLWSISLF